MDQSLEYKIKVMQAFLAGQPIEAFLLYWGNPFDTANPIWNWSSYYYRVKGS